MPKWEVQTYTLADGWINTWEAENLFTGKYEIEVFNTKEEAEIALKEYLSDIQDAVDQGDMLPYDPAEFRVAESK